MSIKNLIHKDLVCCSRLDSVEKVASLMKENQVGSVLVIRNDQPDGIVTDRDIVLRCVATGRPCNDVPVVEIMTPTPESISLDAGLYEAIRLMRKRKARRLPVTDEEGRAVGLIAFDDVFSLLAREFGELAGTVEPDSPLAMRESA